MKKITSRKKLFLYGCAGMGVNMLNIIVGSYLCSALLKGGFAANIESWTYLSKDLVIPAVWSVMILIAKIIDGVIDIPLSSFTDRLKTRWGRRRPSLVLGLVPMVVVYLLFLIVPSQEAGWLNTMWFGILLSLFSIFYTLTMLTYYATFAEIVDNEQDMVFVSNVKSVCDVVYFILGYALVPIFVGMGINIRYVALIFLPLVLLMLIPIFMIKEAPTNKAAAETEGETAEKPLNLWKSIAVSFKNKTFIYWMCTLSMMTFGIQLFLGGINELFSSYNVSMTLVMVAAFIPVPFTLWLYNRIIKKHGLGFAFKYILVIFSIGMFVMFTAGMLTGINSQLVSTLICVAGGFICSFSIGAFFSVGYTVPAYLAQREYKAKGINVSSMYFAVQGLFQGIATGIATGVVLVNLKTGGIILYMPYIVAAACLIAFAMAFAFPKSIADMGKDSHALPKKTL